MRLFPTRRLRVALQAIRRGDAFALVEIALLVVLGIQLARIVWAVATPPGSYGAWRPPLPSAMPEAQRSALFAGFDPFFRTAGGPGGVQTVTSLPLQLFGTRLDEATGQGSAIIGAAGGQQASYIVGDAIAPGATLKEIALDHVVLDRAGHAEMLYLDQSTPVVPATLPAPTPLLPLPPATQSPIYAPVPAPAAPPSILPPPPAANTSQTQ